MSRSAAYNIDAHIASPMIDSCSNTCRAANFSEIMNNTIAEMDEEKKNDRIAVDSFPMRVIQNMLIARIKSRQNRVFRSKVSIN